MDMRIGWAEFDALAAPTDVRVGWAQFDAAASPFAVLVGWAELDARSPNADPVPPFVHGGGVARYHSHASQKYDIPLDIEGEEEEILLAILAEIAAHVLL
jgi:hypothetical protein